MRPLQPIRHLLSLFVVPWILCAQAPSENFTVHGRLIAGNGTPACRIWIVGSKRILGIHELKEEIQDMPEKLLNLLAYGKYPDEYRTIYADFLVESLTQDKPGCMRIVRIISAFKIVVTNDSGIIIRKDHI